MQATHNTCLYRSFLCEMPYLHSVSVYAVIVVCLLHFYHKNHYFFYFQTLIQCRARYPWQTDWTWRRQLLLVGRKNRSFSICAFAITFQLVCKKLIKMDSVFKSVPSCPKFGPYTTISLLHQTDEVAILLVPWICVLFLFLMLMTIVFALIEVSL